MSQVNTIYCSSIDYMLRVIIACLQIYANLLKRWKRCDWCINYCGRCDTGMPPLLHRIMIDMIDVPTCPNQLAEKWLPIWRFRHARGCEPKPWFNSWDEATLLNKSDMEQHFTHSVSNQLRRIWYSSNCEKHREATHNTRCHPISKAIGYVGSCTCPSKLLCGSIAMQEAETLGETAHGPRSRWRFAGEPHRPGR